MSTLGRKLLFIFTLSSSIVILIYLILVITVERSMATKLIAVVLLSVSSTSCFLLWKKRFVNIIFLMNLSAALLLLPLVRLFILTPVNGNIAEIIFQLDLIIISLFYFSKRRYVLYLLFYFLAVNVSSYLFHLNTGAFILIDNPTEGVLQFFLNLVSLVVLAISLFYAITMLMKYQKQLETKTTVLIKQNELLEKLAIHSNHEIRKEVANIIGLVELEITDNPSGSLKMLGKTAINLDTKLRESLSLLENVKNQRDLLVDSI